ncbi:MAG: 3'(2'),5'-bisphosphate nucleotidase CysQ [bacterium]|nr:3'(2'),5'-bisphosphate nucleotidase CysQ [bacterium]
MGYEREVEAAREAALAAGEVVARHSRGDRRSWNKAEDSPVTQADLEANEAILAVLRRCFPDDAVLSEETRDSPERLQAERVWIIDPLDGTKEFIEGVPQFAVSIALAARGEPVVGCVYQPLTKECFWGASGMGAHLNDQHVQVSGATELSECRVLSSRTEMKRGQMDPYQGLFAEIEPVGSVALKLALVSAARGDMWISAAPKSEWDVCGGDLLVREAGGKFITLDQGVRIYNQKNVLLQPLMIAGPPSLVDELRKRSESA